MQSAEHLAEVTVPPPDARSTTRSHPPEPVARVRYLDCTVWGGAKVRSGRASGRSTSAARRTTTGRKTGRPTTTPLIYEQAGDDYVVVASKGGAPAHPGWYRNLAKNPRVEVQVKGDVFPAQARTATGEERERLWKLASQQWPDYDAYQTRTDREIPVVVLERT